jgi:hypothetical protein
MASFARRLITRLNTPEVAMGSGALYAMTWCYIKSDTKEYQLVSPGLLSCYMASGFCGAAATTIIYGIFPIPIVPVVLTSSSAYNLYYSWKYPTNKTKN